MAAEQRTMYYGCTFDRRTCQETFHNRQALHNHELSHGEREDIWHCGEPDQYGGTCHYGYNQAHKLRAHLLEEHRIDYLADFQVEDRIIGETWQTFWCGFCRKVYKVGSRNEFDSSALSYIRIAHIAGHFKSQGNNSEERFIRTWFELRSVDEGFGDGLTGLSFLVAG